MKRVFIFLILMVCAGIANAQNLKLKQRKADALSGSAFAISISDTSLTIKAREDLIFKEIKSGNVPPFLRNLTEIKDTLNTSGQVFTISYWVLPDYIAIGSNADFFYCPMTPMLAQRVATLTKCSLPTKKVVDVIYNRAKIKLEPMPIPPTKDMVTVPVFIAHSEMVKKQLTSYEQLHVNSALTAGNKKDVIISNKIYGEPTSRVVIYGWHKPDGKAIQPVYNKHTNTWADYSHGIRLVQNQLLVNGKKKTYQQVLADPLLCGLLSDEGIIGIAKYPL